MFRLAEESLELRGLAEEQGRACTLLAAELVEMVTFVLLQHIHQRLL